MFNTNKTILLRSVYIILFSCLVIGVILTPFDAITVSFFVFICIYTFILGYIFPSMMHSAKDDTIQENSTEMLDSVLDKTLRRLKTTQKSKIMYENKDGKIFRNANAKKDTLSQENKNFIDTLSTEKYYGLCRLREVGKNLEVGRIMSGRISKKTYSTIYITDKYPNTIYSPRGWDAFENGDFELERHDRYARVDSCGIDVILEKNKNKKNNKLSSDTFLERSNLEKLLKTILLLEEPLEGIADFEEFPLNSCMSTCEICGFKYTDNFKEPVDFTKFKFITPYVDRAKVHYYVESMEKFCETIPYLTLSKIEYEDTKHKFTTTFMMSKENI